MRRVTLRATGGHKIVVHVNEDERCAVCGCRITDDEWTTVVVVGNQKYAAVAHVDHFRPESRFYRRVLKQFVNAAVEKLRGTQDTEINGAHVP
jgi:RNA polymerase subunit RPABC4/transcription elongation factor Spt4